ncbi:MAG: hypothetical protein V7L04_09965 [Nostoc sp.]|uniref:hypothetical protein n=1 Tax=Nostoc sp. TaxID=1180 RepID=UPI002FF9F3C6
MSFSPFLRDATRSKIPKGTTSELAELLRNHRGLNKSLKLSSLRDQGEQCLNFELLPAHLTLFNYFLAIAGRRYQRSVDEWRCLRSFTHPRLSGD